MIKEKIFNSKQEAIDFIKQFDIMAEEEIEIENEITKVTPKEGVKDYTKVVFSPFIQGIPTEDGLIYKYDVYKAVIKVDNLYFTVLITQNRKEYEDKYFFTISSTGRYFLELPVYEKTFIEKDNLYNPAVIKTNELFKIDTTMDLDYYLNNDSKKVILESNEPLKDKEVLVDFKKNIGYYYDYQINSVLFDNKIYLGINIEKLTKEFLDKIIKTHEDIYLKTKSGVFFNIIKRDTQYEDDAYFIDGINYKGIYYHCVSYDENEKNKVITEEKILDYFDIDTLFIR